MVVLNIYLEQLYPTFLLSLDSLLNHCVCLDPHTAEGSHVLLSVLCFSLRVGELNDSQTGISQTPRQSHKL